jgi:hypothetical protein
MRFASSATGLLLHYYINHDNSYADAFSSPHSLANRNGFSTKTLGRSHPSKQTALKGGGGLPDGFELDEDSISDEELNTFESSIMQPKVDRYGQLFAIDSTLLHT